MATLPLGSAALMPVNAAALPELFQVQAEYIMVSWTSLSCRKERGCTDLRSFFKDVVSFITNETKTKSKNNQHLHTRLEIRLAKSERS